MEMVDLRKEMVRYVEDVDIAGVKMLLDEGVSPNSTDDDGEPLLAIAISKGDESIVQLLIDRGADMDLPGWTMTALEYTERYTYGDYKDYMLILLLRNGAKPRPEDLIEIIETTGSLYVSRMMVEMGVDVNAVVDDTTPLLRATQVGNIDIVLFLVEKGADVNYRNRNGITPLSEASYNNDIEIARLLVMNGADVGATDNYGGGPLVAAIKGGSYHMMEVLLRGKGVDLEAISDTIYNCDDVDKMRLLISHGLKVNTDRGGEQLLRACRGGNYDMVRLLVENGANIDTIDIYSGGVTPLMITISTDRLDISTYLMSKGANLDIRDEHGSTALMYAIKGNKVYIARMMIEKGANTRYRDMDGNNALMVQMGNPSSPLYILTLLLNTGMSPDTQNNDGMTPLMKAALMRDPSYLLELLKHGANPNIRNNNGDTALIIASRHRMVEHVRLLLEYGAHTNIKNVNGETAYTATYSTEIRNMISRYSSSTMTGHRWRGRYTDIASV